MSSSSSFSSVLSFCPRCGSGGFEAVSCSGLLCKSCGFRFFFNMAAAVAALITDGDGRLLLTRRAYDPCMGMLDLPGGFVNHGESAEEALKREISEELGVCIKNIRYFASWPNSYLYSGLDYKTLDLAFLAEISDASPLRPGDDVADLFFVRPSEINYDEIAFQSIRKIVHAFSESLGLAGELI